jgi:hypothetical protein
MIFAAFPQVVVGLHSFVYRDFGLFSYPLAHHYRESFWRGEIPLWNPYNNFGIPFLGQWGTMVLYPPSLIYLLLPMPWSLSFFSLLHLFLGGMGMYVLAYQWTGGRFAAALAAIGFVFNGLTLNCLMWAHYTASLAWMPWVIWAVVRAGREGGRWVIYAAFIGAMQMLSGTPEVILFTWLLVVGLVCCEAGGTWKHRKVLALRFAVVVGMIALLSAAQLLPFFQLLSHSTRSSNYAQGQWPIAPWAWANIFVPLFRTYRTSSGVHFQEGQGFTSSYYPGLIFVALAIAALLWRRERRVWVLWSAVFVGVILAMGTHTPLYGLLREVFPPIGFMRYPSKFLLIPLFAWPALAAFGWIALCENRHRWRVHIPVLTTMAVIIISVIVFSKMAPHPGENWFVTLRNGIERLALLAVLVAIIGWALRGVGVTQVGTAGILLVIWFDLLRHVPTQNPTAMPQAFTAKPAHLEQMQPRPVLGQSRALLTLSAIERFHSPGTSNVTETHLVHRSGLYDNCNLVDRIPKADGFFSLYLQSERAIHYRLYETDSRPRVALARFLGISHVSGETNILAWQPLSGFLPLVTAGQQPIFADREATLAGLVATNFNGAQMVYLPPDAQREVQVQHARAARVISTRVDHHKIEAEVEASSPSVVVVSQIHYPAWRAYIDGQPARLWPANHAFQALYVGPGRHTIRWVYRDVLFWLGALISAITFGGCLAALWVCRSALRRAPIRDMAETPCNTSGGLAGSRVGETAAKEPGAGL